MDLLPVASLCCMNGCLRPWIYLRIPAGIETARREVANTKQFIKAKLHTEGGRAGTSLQVVWD